ncbi:MAG: MATE family efflux transporter [Spirochaetales bacterium]|nr:MATE family efflux transporter [Spirochaetales bacterium]
MKSKITDMTVGSPSRHILTFALPLFIGNIFQQLYNMVDSIIVGNFVGANALAAVGTCGSMGFFCFSLSAGLSIGIGIVVAQYFGAKNDQMVRYTIGSSIFVLSFAAIIVSLFGFFCCPYILKLLQCPEKIRMSAVVYMRTTVCGLIFVALYNGVAAILRALGDSKSPLYFLILSSIINLLLDLFFVLKMGLGVFGVAVATCISQAASAITSIIYAYKKIEYFRLTKSELRPHKKIIFSSLKIGIPVSMQSCLISISMMVLQGVVNTFGETIMAAYTIVMRVEQLVQQPYSSIGAAITNYSGQNIGAGLIDRVKKGFHRGTFIVLIFSLIMLPLFWIFGETIIGFFVKEEESAEVILIGAKALRITSLCYFMLGMIYVPRAVLNGCGDSGFAMINGITEVIGRIGFAPVLTRIPKFGFWGIWLTTGITWTITSIVCVIRYKTGIWKRKGIIVRENINE